MTSKVLALGSWAWEMLEVRAAWPEDEEVEEPSGDEDPEGGSDDGHVAKHDQDGAAWDEEG